MSIRDLIVIVMATEFGLHYFPWRMALGRELPRLAAYTLGLLGMMVPLSMWLMDHDEIEILQTLWTVIFTAGLTVFALYGLDRYLELARRDVEAGQREELLAKQLKDQGNEQGR
ncbi:MAG: hypothetical protein HY863_15605 [Chloroflexi bacterium]|nr:hypothetical protein [Chloroflexota bacterium]